MMNSLQSIIASDDVDRLQKCAERMALDGSLKSENAWCLTLQHAAAKCLDYLVATQPLPADVRTKGLEWAISSNNVAWVKYVWTQYPFFAETRCQKDENVCVAAVTTGSIPMLDYVHRQKGFAIGKRCVDCAIGVCREKEDVTLLDYLSDAGAPLHDSHVASRFADHLWKTGLIHVRDKDCSMDNIDLEHVLQQDGGLEFLLYMLLQLSTVDWEEIVDIVYSLPGSEEPNSPMMNQFHEFYYPFIRSYCPNYYGRTRCPYCEKTRHGV